MPVPFSIRAMRYEDASLVAQLLPHLGYSGTPDECQRRFNALSAWPDNAVFLAEMEERVVGLCQIHGVRLIASNGYAEVAALVVHTEYQRQGVGKELLRCAATWAKDLKYERLRLRSGIYREDAHRFYEAVGFPMTKASFAFERNLQSNME